MAQRIYISGPISRMPKKNRPAFDQAAAELRAAGYEPVSPFDNGVDPDAEWGVHMRADIKMMVDCDGVAVLKGWTRSQAISRGANVEVDLARALGMPVERVDAWLFRKAAA